MYTNFPGLNSYLAEKKVIDIENSITNSLIGNNETPQCKFKFIYILGFICVGGLAAIITYVCIKFFYK